MIRLSPSAARLVFTVSRVTAVAALIPLLVIFVAAGQLVTTGLAEDLHGVGAVVLHVVTGILAAGLGVLALARQGSWLAFVLAAAVFAATFGQAALGETATLAAHVIGALVLSIGVAGFAVWAIYTALPSVRSRPVSDTNAAGASLAR